jgi:hypothetical protein
MFHASDQMPGQYTANKEPIYTTATKRAPANTSCPDQYWIEFAQASAKP